MNTTKYKGNRLKTKNITGLVKLIFPWTTYFIMNFPLRNPCFVVLLHYFATQ